MHNVSAKITFYEYVGGGAGVGKKQIDSKLLISP